MSGGPRHERQNHTRGRATTPEFRSWCGMIQRCTDTNHVKYHRYGGRGIKVCDRWLQSFELFFEDMGPRPTGMTLDRINNDGHYEPGNCRWATNEEQANKRSTNRVIEHNGEKKTVSEWAQYIGISYSALQSRIERGWPLDLALDPKATRQGKAKIERATAIAEERAAFHAEIFSCEGCGKPFTRKTKRTRCCSEACRKKVTKKKYYETNKDRINANRRAKNAESTHE